MAVRRRIGDVVTLVATIIALATPGRTLRPQAMAPAGAWRVGAMVGATPALGDFGKSFKTGLHAGGFAQWGMDQGRLALRADIQLHQHDYKFGGMTWRTLATTLNALVRSPDGRGPSAYGLAGIGVYSFKASTTGARGTTDSADEIKLGFSIGAGVVRSIGSYKAFAEMRLHSAASSGSRVQFMPLSVGLIF